MNRFKILLAIFVTTLSTVVIEILYTRVFSLVYSSQFAFLMISLAMFGYGLSGFYVSQKSFAKDEKSILLLEKIFFAMALSLPVIYKINLTATVDFLKLFSPPSNLLLLILNCAVLIVPFFLAGTALALIFTLYSEQIGKLYFVDLVGAGLGGLAVIPLITGLGPTRTILVLCAMFGLTWFLIGVRKTVARSLAALGMIAVFVVLALFSESVFPIVPKMEKRGYLFHYHNKLIKHSKWSPINKIDVAPQLPDRDIIWIDGGSMESPLFNITQPIAKYAPVQFVHESMPYQLARKGGSAFIIGSAGGYEVFCALTNGFKNVVAVEMDPEICRLVREDYAPFLGHLFTQKGVHLINDEGRSVLRRLDRSFDVIHMINSHNTDALLSGGLSIAETYIYTVESFIDYWNHLNDDGFLAIVHINGERMFSTAMQALRELKIPQPDKKIFVVQHKLGFNYFFLKKGEFTDSDIDTLTRFSQRFAGSLNENDKWEIVHHPYKPQDNLYGRLAGPEYKKVLAESSVNIKPVRDNSPYFNQPNKIGQFTFKNNWISGDYGREFIERNRVYSNSVYLSILGIAILFSLLFIFIPLFKKSRGQKMEHRAILYFFCIGLAYMVTEIILIKVFQLYLGNPAYSISVIIFSLLVSSGIGSLLSQKVERLLKGRALLVLSLIIAALIVLTSLFMFELVYSLIHFSWPVRFLISLLIISMLGLPMGMFFPIGMRFLGNHNPLMIGWAWGANSFATVIASVMAVILATNTNFTVTLFVAAGFYLMAGLVMRRREL